MINFSRIVFGLAVAVSLSQFASGATYTVTNSGDTNDGICDSNCSLREAVVAANGTADNDTIVFSALFNFVQTITLGGTDIIITNNGTLFIFGPGADKLTVSGNNASRVFTNNTGSVATISNLRVTGGTGVSTVTTARGGGVYNNAGTLTLNNLIITGNTATNGGGLNNAGTASVINLNNCHVFGNTATNSGGGMQNFSTSTLNISNSSITGNTSGSDTVGGGGIQGNGTVNITNSTIANNTANTGSGGGIFFNGTALTITNSTFSGNISTSNGGGIHKSTANPGNIRNTIIANNNNGTSDATGAFNSLGNNIVGTVGTSTGWIMSDLQNTNPVLSPLGFYGGNGLSYALLSTSPALNAGQNCVTNLSCATNNPAVAVTTDQRGAARPFGAAVDIGAFESSTDYVAILPSVRVGFVYSFDITPNVGMSTYSLTGGMTPPGISFSTIAMAATLRGTPNQSGTSEFTITINTGGNTASVRYALTVFSNAGNGTVSGRILRANGNGIGKVTVTLLDNNGNVRQTLSSSFGYYNFADLNIGETFQIQVSSKTYSFNPSSITFTMVDNISNLNFTALP